MMAIIGGMGVMGYMYMKKHPEIKKMFINMKNDAMNSMNKMMKED